MATGDWDRLNGYSYCERRALSNFAGKRYLPFQHLGERQSENHKALSIPRTFRWRYCLFFRDHRSRFDFCGIHDAIKHCEQLF